MAMLVLWRTPNKFTKSTKIKWVSAMEAFGADAFRLWAKISKASKVMTTSCFTLATTVVVPWDDFVWCGEAIVHATACPEDGGGKNDPQERSEENVIPVVEKCNQNLECRRQGVDNQPPSELTES